MKEECNSIKNLPSIKNLQLRAALLKEIGKTLNNKEAQEEAARIKDKIARISNIGDSFYTLLGDRNWVLSDSLDLDRMQIVIEKDSPEAAETELITYFKEGNVLQRILTRLNGFPDMRTRITMLEKAARDYREERYYSSTLVVVSMMDGFVSDAFKEQRKCLSARDPEEMYFDDCTAAVWEGLPTIQKVFTQHIGKRNDDPVNEVYRHGIMHGMLTDYDNVIVATKAWCMLAGICDWVEAKMIDKEKPAKTENKETRIQKLERLSEKNRCDKETSQRLENWQPHDIDLINPVNEDVEIINSCTNFFEAWKAKNYGLLSTYCPFSDSDNPKKIAGETREIYSKHPIRDFQIEQIVHNAPAVLNVYAKIDGSEKSWNTNLRVVRMNDSEPVAFCEKGKWKIMGYGIDPFKDFK